MQFVSSLSDKTFLNFFFNLIFIKHKIETDNVMNTILECPQEKTLLCWAKDLNSNPIICLHCNF